ncbi:hypothetical protein BpHYR1_042628 [Brachionus plicatilis]|uniref:Uncharacterized protein n=1 Tax=Brachionus plicatilis TaxID=10195 RepID=A0A3M7T867_BRAPC|nr:hypothetical protein BpHYR1_042628 [Brachionus plicatilis]
MAISADGFSLKANSESDIEFGKSFSVLKNQIFSAHLIRISIQVYFLVNLSGLTKSMTFCLLNQRNNVYVFLVNLKKSRGFSQKRTIFEEDSILTTEREQ